MRFQFCLIPFKQKVKLFFFIFPYLDVMKINRKVLKNSKKDELMQKGFLLIQV